MSVIAGDVLLMACRTLLIKNLPALPQSNGSPILLTPERIHIGHISKLQNPDGPVVTLDRTGGSAELPIAGYENPLTLIQTWSRKNQDEANVLYAWVSQTLNMRRIPITREMKKLFPAAYCHTFYRQWLGWAHDPTDRWWYVTARYSGRAFDGVDSYAAWGPDESGAAPTPPAGPDTLVFGVRVST